MSTLLSKPDAQLIAELLNCNVPKSEREWAASREIERLKDEVERLTGLLSNVEIPGVASDLSSGEKPQYETLWLIERGSPATYLTENKTFTDDIDKAKKFTSIEDVFGFIFTRDVQYLDMQDWRVCDHIFYF